MRYGQNDKWKHDKFPQELPQCDYTRTEDGVRYRCEKAAKITKCAEGKTVRRCTDHLPGGVKIVKIRGQNVLQYFVDPKLLA